MPSVQIDRFQSESRLITAGALEMAPAVGATLSEQFDVYLEEGEKAIDWVLLQKLISRMLASKGRRLDEVDQSLELERTNSKSLRAERDRLVVEMRRELRAARFLLDEKFDRDLATGIFRRRELSRVTPLALVRLARETAESLRAPGLQVSRQLDPGAFPEPANLADVLDRRAQALDVQLELLAPKRKRETFGVGEKDQEWQEAMTARMRGQDMLFGLYRGAGYDHLAARLRAKRRKKEENGNLGSAGGPNGAASEMKGGSAGKGAPAQASA